MKTAYLQVIQMDKTKVKAKLEKALDNDLKKWYISVILFYNSHLGYIPDLPAKYKDDLQKVLQKHYSRVINIYTITGSQTINQMMSEILTEVETEFRLKTDKKTNEIFDSTIMKAVAIFGAVAVGTDGQIMSPQEIRSRFRSQASVDFRNKAKGESITATNHSVEKITGTIAKTSTVYLANLAKKASSDYQRGAEYKPTLNEMSRIAKASQRQSSEGFVKKVAKEIDSGNIEDVGLVATGFLVLTKEWETVGDDNVRDTHRETERGGAIPVNQPFVVGNSLMMYPSDDSLGADFKEIVGCRCSAVYL